MSPGPVPLRVPGRTAPGPASASRSPSEPATGPSSPQRSPGASADDALARVLRRRDRPMPAAGRDTAPRAAGPPGHAADAGPPAHASQRLHAPQPSTTPTARGGGPVATTDATGTTVDLAAVPPGRLPEVLAHEQVHAAQLARPDGGAAPAGEGALEAEARAGSREILAGRPFTPVLTAGAGEALHFGPEDWFPAIGPQGEREAGSLGGAGLTNPDAAVTTSFATSTDGRRQGMEYRDQVSAGGATGTVVTTTVVTLTHDPDRTAGLVGPATVQINPEQALGPVTTVPAYPYELRYERVISYTDRDGRVVDVEVTGRVWFSERTWADQVGQTTAPSFDALLALTGDRGEMTARLTGSSPVTPYWVELASDARSVTTQTQSAVETFFGGPGSRYSAVRRAAFLDPRTTAGEQFTSLRAALSVVDAVTLRQRSDAQVSSATGSDLADLVGRGLAAILGPVFAELDALGAWLDELIPAPPEWFVGAMTAAMEGLAWLGAELTAWWQGLDPRLRGVLKAIGWFVVGLLAVAAVALVVVAAAEALGVALAFGTAMLIVGAVLLVGTFLYSAVVRTVEAVTVGRPEDVLLVPTVALMDTVGISAIIEAFTDRSVLTGRTLGRSVEERWEGGTSGVLQLISLILMARGLRGGPPRGNPAEVTWRGDVGDFRTIPRERLGRLPEGHTWRRGPSGEWVVDRAPDAPAVPLEVTVSADGQGRVSHVVRSGDTVLHSDTMPRAPGDTRTSGPRLPAELEGTGAENPYRVPNEPNPMDKGHLTDYADVFEGPDAHNLNTDPRNFTPQARWWNRWVRNTLVQNIRLRGGGYREIPIYDGPVRTTVDGTRIPSHYVFVETGPQGQAVRAWRVPNDNALTGRTQAVLPQYAIDPATAPRGLVSPEGRVARPGTWVAGVQVVGQLGRDERRDDGGPR